MGTRNGDPFPKNRVQMRVLLAGLKVLRRGRPLLKMVGIKLDADLIERTISMGQGLLEVADDFNQLFASRGWVACGAINLDAARAAIATAKAGRWEDADRLLADAYSPQLVRIYVRQLGQLRCFAKRERLALLAVEDYEAERYHACIPVALALLDGMGQELTGANFFRNTLRIKAKESFLEIGPGIAELLKGLSLTRKSTTVDPISMPYRHGIVHGTDLGYDNRIVAAKAWAALLAVGHYATDYLTPPPTPQPSLMETLKSIGETQKRIEELERAQNAWLPRTADDLRALVSARRFLAGTPEGAADALLKAWSAKNFGSIASGTADALNESVGPLAGRIRRSLGPAPTRYEVLEIEESGSTAAWVRMRLEWNDEHDEVRLRLVYYKGDTPHPRTAPGGRWLLMSLWPLESARSAALDNQDSSDE